MIYGENLTCCSCGYSLSIGTSIWFFYFLRHARLTGMVFFRFQGKSTLQINDSAKKWSFVHYSLRPSKVENNRLVLLSNFFEFRFVKKSQSINSQPTGLRKNNALWNWKQILIWIIFFFLFNSIEINSKKKSYSSPWRSEREIKRRGVRKQVVALRVFSIIYLNNFFYFLFFFLYNNKFVLYC